MFHSSYYLAILFSALGVALAGLSWKRISAFSLPSMTVARLPLDRMRHAI